MSNDPPTMGLAEAAKACSISVSTLRRRKETLIAAGATVDSKGWQIPIPALVSLGYLSSTTAGHDTASAVAMPPIAPSPGATPLQPDTSEVDLLRRQLAEAETRAQVAEAIAAERERIIDAQAMTLRMLERGNSDTRNMTAPDAVSDTPDVNLNDGPVSAAVRPAARRLRNLLGFGRQR